MNWISAPPRGPDCPPAIELESLSISGESPHLVHCASCRNYVEELRVENASYVRQRPFELLEAKLALRDSKRALPRWWQALAGTTALVAAVTWFSVNSVDRVREKGGSQPFKVFIRRSDGAVSMATSGDVVKSGDTLKFSFESAQEGELLILELDGRETTSVVHPFGSARSVHVSPGKQVLEGSVEVDDAPGPEWLVAVFAPAGFDAQPLQDQLKGQSARARLQLNCGKCQWQAVRLNKK